MAVHLLGVRDGPAIATDLPVEAAAGFVPEFVRQASGPAAGHGQVQVGLGGEAAGGLGAGPGEPALEDDALVAASGAGPVERVVLVESAPLLIHRDGEELFENLLPQVGLGLIGDAKVGFLHWAGGGSVGRHTGGARRTPGQPRRPPEEDS